jgi:hypothetical protein
MTSNEGVPDSFDDWKKSQQPKRTAGSRQFNCEHLITKAFSDRVCQNYGGNEDPNCINCGTKSWENVSEGD